MRRPGSALQTALAAAPPRPHAGSVAFDDVFRELAPQVLRLLQRLGVPPGDVDDVAQEVFVTVARKLSEFEGRSSLRTWVYAIATRHASNRRHKLARSARALGHPDSHVEMLADGREPTDDLEAREALRVAEQLIAELPAKLHVVFVLFEVEGLPIAEVAKITGAPSMTVYARLYAARRRIKAQLRRLAVIGGAR